MRIWSNEEKEILKNSSLSDREKYECLSNRSLATVRSARYLFGFHSKIIGKNKYTKQYIDIKYIIKLYESGMSQDEIAKKLGTTQKVIWKRFKEANYKCRIAKKRNQYGSYNDSWKGKKATYAAKHYRIYKILGKPKKCDVCYTNNPLKRYEWANLTGDYDNPKDYKRMCKKCHSEYGLIHLD